jgi:serine/threonine protein kinase
VRHAFSNQYEVDREIGRGGAARVFLVVDKEGQKLALKILHPELLESVAADRFLREIKLVSQLSNRHIARLLDSGERDWFVYLAMEFVDGPTLREALGRGRRLSFADTLRVACDLLDALDHAHQFGIVHRDVKPENVVICSERGAVLLDFGIARAIITSVSDEITRTGVTVGSSAYMSPEQINGDQKIDGRSDLYSLGCVLFECLAGRPLFVWRKEAVVLQLHLTEPSPDVRSIRPDVPSELAEAISKALAKLPGERWQSAAEMREILASLSRRIAPQSDLQCSNALMQPTSTRPLSRPPPNREKVFDECRAPQLLPLTVLVADDDDGVRHFIARELEQVGFRVLTATNGDKALRMLEQSETEVHLVVCDLLMPVLDGYQLAARLETLPNAPEILFISAYRSDLEFDRPVFTKPFHLNDLSATVQRILQKRSIPVPQNSLKAELR